MKALIDGDILLYRVGYTTEDVDFNIAVWRMDKLITTILSATQTSKYHVALSAGRTETFRAEIYPEYKANRTQPKPLHYDELKTYLIQEWGAVVEVGQEADDRLGIEQNENTIICSIDKDLLQIPGHHYNFVKEAFSFVTEEEGILHFYKQLLTGDVIDNIRGVTGIGAGKAAKLLDPEVGQPEGRLFSLVREKYVDWLQREWADRDWGEFEEQQVDNIIQLNGRLLKIRRKEGELWELPIIQSYSHEMEQEQSSIQQSEEESFRFTVR